ncbi:PleD family two-component system response regulator [Glaciimonas sp. PAMC28666]|uniref:response regulator n=1 Tax=Glaciimonas sp. PAMC28666 TaxID=2807626 RepID=UPI001965194A|nr:response regulator [Glaciimonas sp. PAMC28666]QRX82854.1 response regulator [Glaciimonas sp. PAMC28666]
MEDNPLLVGLYKNALAALTDVCFVIAVNGLQGLIQTCENGPDIIIADLDMPDLDGFKMVNILHLDPVYRHVPLIIISGLKEADILARGGLPDGASFIRKKNFSPLELRTLVTNRMEKKGSECISN